MNVNDMPFLPVVYLNKLVEAMVEEQIYSEDIFRECGINSSVLTKPEAFLSVYQARAIISHYLSTTQQSFAGLRYGQRLDLMAHGLFAYVFTARVPFRELTTAILHYFQVRIPLMVLTIRHDTHYIAISVSYRHPLPEIEAFVTQSFLSSMYTLVAMVTKHCTLHFESRILPDTRGVETVINIPVETGHHCNEIRIYAAKHTPQTASTAVTDKDPNFEDHDLAVRMRAYLLTHVEQAISAEVAAQHFHMSVRTLRRRLADIGMSFNDIRLEVRMHAATRYLKTSNLSIARISGMVGYSDQASFSRAYQKWGGETPDVVRKKHRQMNKRVEEHGQHGQ